MPLNPRHTTSPTQGKHAVAEKIYRGVQAAELRVLGPEHPDTLSTTSNLSKALRKQGQSETAAAISRGVLAVQVCAAQGFLQLVGV